MKSAYELALERLEAQGIERPREEGLPAETRAAMDEIKSQAEAKLAELEIYYRDKRRSLYDPAALSREEDNYRRERRRIEDDRDRKLEKLRNEATASP